MQRLNIALALVLVGSALPAAATTIDLVNDRNESGTYNWTLSYAKDGVGLNVKGYSNTDGTTDIQRDKIGTWSGGLGVEERNSPEHALNNANNDYDMLLFTFDQSVVLDNISVGWIGNDSDVSVLAKTGPSGSGVSVWGDLLTNGWSLIDQESNVNSSGRAINGGNVSATQWLIGAYNPVYQNMGWTLGNEEFKLKTVSFTAADVPAPSTLVTLLVGVFGLLMARRRTRQS